MPEKVISQLMLKELNTLFYNYPAIEQIIFFCKLYSSYLRECAESGLPENFAHESCMIDQWFAVLELAIKEKLK